MGQINFDGKLMKGLEGYGKVNRLAVVLVQETENKLLCIAKMEQSRWSSQQTDSLASLSPPHP